jgi:hypothetical protein
VSLGATWLIITMHPFHLASLQQWIFGEEVSGRRINNYYTEAIQKDFEYSSVTMDGGLRLINMSWQLKA